eukprot:scaffold14615_cov65-Cyclotella_meneghiniana.AAC.14
MNQYQQLPTMYITINRWGQCYKKVKHAFKVMLPAFYFAHHSSVCVSYFHHPMLAIERNNTPQPKTA